MTPSNRNTPRAVLACAALAALVQVGPAVAANHAPAQPAAHAGHAAAPAAAAASAAEQPMAMPDKASAEPAMDHGNMRMQGGPAPADARDPHAYSGGYTLESGPYALGSPRQLRLGDEKLFGMVLVDNLEAVRSKGQNSGAYDLMARVGRDYNRLVIKAEGEVVGGKIKESRTEALWSHAVATFWDAQLGVRRDGGSGPARNWLAVGMQGLAPYWFEIDATAYVGEGGRFALRLAAEYELLITQKLILQPRVEANAFSQSDPARELGKGLSDVTASLRLRYEFTRQFAPYIGVEWAGLYGGTADLARAAGERTRETRIVAGLRFWF